MLMCEQVRPPQFETRFESQVWERAEAEIARREGREQLGLLECLVIITRCAGQVAEEQGLSRPAPDLHPEERAPLLYSAVYGMLAEVYQSDQAHAAGDLPAALAHLDKSRELLQLWKELLSAQSTP